MPEVSANSSDTVTRTIEGVDYLFGKITPKDRQAILTRLKAERKATLIANAKAVNLDDKQIFAELENFEDNVTYGQLQWERYVNTDSGQADVCGVAWKKKNPDKDFDSVQETIESFDGALLPLAADVCGFRLLKRAEDASKTEGETPSPLKGYGS